MRARIIVTLTWLAALGLALWILTRLPLATVLQTLGDLRPWQWAAWIGLNLFVIALLTARWRVLTTAMALPVDFLQLLRIRQAGMVISFVTPGPQFGGEPLQVYWLWQRHATPGPAAFLAVGLDRFYELWVNFTVLLLAVLSLLTAASVAFVDWRTLAVVLLGLVLTMAVSGWLLLRQPLRLREWIRRLTRPWRHQARLGRLKSHWSELNAALQRLFAAQRPALAGALGLSLLAWVLLIGEFWFLLGVVGVPFDLTAYIFLFTVVRLAVLLPLPGGIGSVEAGLFWAFQALALPLSAAASLILLVRLRDAVILLTGAVALPGLHAPAAPADSSEQ